MIGTLSLGALTLSPASRLDVQYGAAGSVNDLLRIAGNLTLDGVLDITDIGGFGEGVYRVFDYGGVLSDNGLALGVFPAGFDAADLIVQTAQPGQVNLVVSFGGLGLQFWDGTQSTGDGAIAGGDGIWNLANSNWTNPSGSVNAAWASGFAVFSGATGTVTLAEPVSVGGMQFTTNGYRIVPSAGAQLQADASFVVRTDPGVTATVDAPIVDGPVSSQLRKLDAGTLVLGGTNTYTGGTQVEGGVLQIAADANLGAASGALMLDSGTLRNTAAMAMARAVTLGAGGGTFDTQADLVASGSIGGAGDLTKTGSAALVMSAPGTYAGATHVDAGTLRAGIANALPATTAVTVASGATLDLAGFDQTIASLANAGLVQTHGQGQTRLSVTGAYVGQNGLLELATVLGDDDSPSDRLVIDGGTATGTTGMLITPLPGGGGALTVRNGILVVDDVTGQTTAPGAFALVAPVLAGPYEYGLFRGSLDASNAQAWYLRSTVDCSGPTPPVVCPAPPTPAPPDPPTPTPPTPAPVPNYRMEVSLYSALPALGLRYGRALLGTLHERVGEQDLLRGRDELDNGNVLNGAWVRLIGLRGDADGDRLGIYGEDGPQYDFDLVALQGGVDVYRAEHDDGRRDHAGVGLAHGRIKSDVTHVIGPQRAGEAEIEGTTLSAYWTHYGRNGGYVDAVLQGTWFDADAISTRGVELRTSEGGVGWAASLEAGLPFRRGDWSIEPQAQLVYQSIDDLDGRDVGAQVRFRDTESLAARAGVRFARTHELTPAPDGASRAVTGWVRLNYWHEFEAKPVTSFSSQVGEVPFRSDLTGGWGQLNLGISAQLGRNTSLYANLNYENGLGGRYDAWDGSIGLRWNW